MTGWRRGALAAALVVGGCDWSLHRMQEQPKCTTGAQTSLLPGGMCNLAPPSGTVAWRADLPAPRPAVDRALLVRGRDRYDRFCAPCHGLAADSDAAVSRAMLRRRPPPLVDRVVAQMSDERIEHVIRLGYGMMPSYAEVLAPADRWAIVAYVRVLQSREVELEALPLRLREEARSWLR